MTKDFMLLFIAYLRCFNVKYFIQHTHSGANMYMCTRVVICVCLCAYTYVCAYGYPYGYIDMRIYVFVSASACLLFLSAILILSSMFHYIKNITHCVITLLCTLMLYICDRSTPDLTKDDELELRLLIGYWGTNFGKILFKIHTFSFKIMHLKMSSGK